MVLLDILAAGLVDDSGEPLSNGLVYVYAVGTTTKVAVYADSNLTNPTSNPITLDAAGKAEVYTEESVRLVIEDEYGNQIDDIDSVGVVSTVGEFTDDFLPDVSDTHDIGSAAKRVAEIHTNDLYVYDDAFIENLVRVGAANPGWINNLSIQLQAGVFSVVGADGTVLSTENPGYVVCPSTTAGRPQLLKVTSGGSFNDDSHASSSLTNLGFGLTESVAWANDRPFFLYVANRGNADIDGADGSSVFFIALDPRMHTTPSSANDIGDTGGIPSNDSKNVILILDDVTIANYTSLPCQLIGSFRMQWSTVTDDYTVQTIGNSDGLGAQQLAKTFSTVWTMPLGQNGAAASNFLLANGGTAPVFTTNSYSYVLMPDGRVAIDFFMDADGGTDGAGAVATLLSLPYSIISPTNQRAFGVSRVENSTFDMIAAVRNSTDGISMQFLIATRSGSALQDDVEVVDNSDFGNGGRSIAGTAVYKAF